LRAKEIRPVLVVMTNRVAMRPVQAAGVLTGPLARVKEEQAIEVLQCVLAVARLQSIQRVGQQRAAIAAVAGAAARRVVHAILLHLDPIENFAFDLQRTAADFAKVVGEAAINSLARRAVFVLVHTSAKERFGPVL